MVGGMSTSDTPMASPRQSPVLKIVGAVAAVAVLAFGASAIAKHGSSPSAAQGGPQGAPQGVSPQGGPGMFAPVTGGTLAKLKAVATAKYPGTVERAVQLPDGSYEVHVIQASGQELHVRVTAGFKLAGTERDFRGGPPAGQAPDDQATPRGTRS
jgi:hypothetical protein